MLTILMWILALPPLIALLIFTAESLLGLMPFEEGAIDTPYPSTTILMPAHNEAATIGSVLDNLESISNDDVHFLIVADNCDDDTADIARSRGYEVIERYDAEHRGKGFALAFGRDHLAASPPECVVILDADCEIDPVSVAMLSRTCIARDISVQAHYVFKPDLKASAKVQMSNFALWIKNVVRQRGGRRLGSPAILNGTGMAFPWRVFQTLPLATPNIVEDLALGIYLTRMRQAPVFTELAHIQADAAAETATLQQRTRWEHGFLETARTIAFAALREGIATGNRKLFQVGLHLMVPPLAFLLLLSFAILVLLGFIAEFTGQWASFLALGFGIFLAFFAIFTNWLAGGYRWLSFGALIQLPLYMTWKIPVYLGFARGETVGWTRTDRSAEKKD